MHSSVTDSFAFSAKHAVRSRVTMLSVSTVKELAMPKFAIAPIPKVPTTPAACASGVFLLLEPAFQKFFLSSSTDMPFPLSEKQPDSEDVDLEDLWG